MRTSLEQRNRSCSNRSTDRCLLPRHAHSGDAAGAFGDGNSVRNPIEPVDKYHHVGCLRGGACTTRAHCDAGVRSRQRWCIIDTVAHHDGRVLPLLGRYGVYLVGGLTIREHRVDTAARANTLTTQAMQSVTGSESKAPQTHTVDVDPSPAARRLSSSYWARWTASTSPACARGRSVTRPTTYHRGSIANRSIEFVGQDRQRKEFDAFLVQRFGLVRRGFTIDRAVLDLAVVDLTRLLRETGAHIIRVPGDVLA
jgi:hypothetical protein